MMLPTVPLAERMRPQSLDDVLGQEHITGAGSLMRQAIQTGLVPSLILWGPPGVGKTTLAQIIAQAAGLGFFQLSAISSGVKEVREVIDQAKKQRGAVLFIDEIHRFNKGQQDALLGAVEKGTIRLIGATTENPSFEVNAALLSRSQVYVLKSLTETHLEALLHKALAQDAYLQSLGLVLTETKALVQLSGGDGRKLLNLLEMVVQTGCRQITDAEVLKIAQQKTLRYDKKGEQHYDIISAFIKSMRGSDPNGAVYWMARMIEGGEDVKFIARRMLIFASEDVGNANPNALLLANACFDAVQKIGYPESRIILSQCATYLASSVKSNAAYEAIGAAQKAVQETGDLAVPLHLRNGATGLMKEMGYGENYQYSHLGQNNFIEQEYLPEPLVGKAFYVPGKNPREAELQRFLSERWKGKYGY